MALMSFKVLPPGSVTSLVNDTLAYKQEVQSPSAEEEVESSPWGSEAMCKNKKDDKVRASKEK